MNSKGQEHSILYIIEIIVGILFLTGFTALFFNIATTSGVEADKISFGTTLKQKLNDLCTSVSDASDSDTLREEVYLSPFRISSFLKNVTFTGSPSFLQAEDNKLEVKGAFINLEWTRDLKATYHVEDCDLWGEISLESSPLDYESEDGNKLLPKTLYGIEVSAQFNRTSNQRIVHLNFKKEGRSKDETS